MIHHKPHRRSTMHNNHKKRKHTRLLSATIILVGVSGALFLGRDAILQKVRTTAATEIGKKLLEQQISATVNINGQEIEVSDVMNQMDEEDVEKVSTEKFMIDWIYKKLKARETGHGDCREIYFTGKYQAGG